jgi:uncharacterized coiled-coil DUF342 family protein
MKFLFNLLKLFPAFQKLLNEFVANENAELKKQAEAWQERFLDMRTAAENYATEAKAAAQVADAYRLNMESALAKIEQRDAEIEELRNERTEKLQAVDNLDSESVFNATLFQPRSTPRS